MRSASRSTPYPGTETWTTDARTLTTRDYKLFDVQHAVLPTRLSLARFYEELVKTQQILFKKHMGWRALRDCTAIAAGHLARGQTNFLRSLFKFGGQYDVYRSFWPTIARRRAIQSRFRSGRRRRSMLASFTS